MGDDPKLASAYARNIAAPLWGREPAILSIVGTRPEAIKMAPVARALAARRRLRHRLVLTGQHSGLSSFFGGIAADALCELRFDPRGRSAVGLREGLHRRLCGHLQSDRPDLVLVHGDTTSALAGAFAARDCGLDVAHVEAGLRSFDLRQPWPEEGHRVVIDALSSLLFAPTERAAANLRRDWRVKGDILVTGNTGIDALLETVRTLPPSPRSAGKRRPILVTCHRKENQGEAVAAVCDALKRLVRELPVRVELPLHSNPAVRSALERGLAGETFVRLHEPLGYAEMVALMKRCWALLTDSGGLQEEGPALGKPVFVLRAVTERPEALATGNLELVGTEPGRIVAAVRSLFEDPEKLERMSRPCLAFGDGRAAPRIAAAVEQWLMRRRWGDRR
jgi:UDP-N-acetylglucosamine 2-epimerase (non-hydrolysing)